MSSIVRIFIENDHRLGTTIDTELLKTHAALFSGTEDAPVCFYEFPNIAITLRSLEKITLAWPDFFGQQFREIILSFFCDLLLFLQSPIAPGRMNNGLDRNSG